MADENPNPATDANATDAGASTQPPVPPVSRVQASAPVTPPVKKADDELPAGIGGNTSYAGFGGTN